LAAAAGHEHHVVDLDGPAHGGLPAARTDRRCPDDRLNGQAAGGAICPSPQSRKRARSMNPVTITLLTFIGLLIARVPVAFCLAAASIVGLALHPDQIPLSMVTTSLAQGLRALRLSA